MWVSKCEALNIADLWHSVPLLCETDLTRSPCVESTRCCQVFDALDWDCIAPVYSPASLSHSWTTPKKNCLTQIVCNLTPPPSLALQWPFKQSFLNYPYNPLALSWCCSSAFTSISFFFAEVSKKTLLQTSKVMRLSAIPMILIQPYHLLSSMQKKWHCGWKMVLAAQSTIQLTLKDCKLLLMPNARSLDNR